jgi:hypothetical protein
VGKDYDLMISEYQSPLYKTYKMRYPWFNYRGFLSFGDEIDINLGNRNIYNGHTFVVGAQPSELFSSPYTINGEKAMKFVYSTLFPIIDKGLLKIKVNTKTL